MKILSQFLCCLFVMLLVLFLSDARAQVTLNEVMFNPSGSEFFDEYIELYNPTESPINLAGWRIGDGDGTDVIVATKMGLVLAPNQYALILDADYALRSTHYGPLPNDALILTVNSSTLGNGGLNNETAEEVVLISSDGDTVSSMVYVPPNASGISEEKIDPLGGNEPENWADAKWVNGTPGRVNSVSVKAVDLALQAVRDVVIVPWGQMGRFELWAVNVGRQNIDGFHVQLTGLTHIQEILGGVVAVGDSIRVVVYEGPVVGGRYQVRAKGIVAGDEDADNQTAVWSVMGGYAPGLVVINEVMAAPGGGEEWVELWNVSDDGVDLGGWTLQDARSSVKIQGGIVPGQGFAMLANENDADDFALLGRLPTLNNGGDVLELLDATDTVIDRVAYPSATPDVSLERIDAFGVGTDLSNWLNSTQRATPNAPNSVMAVHTDSVHLVAEPNPFDTETRIVYQLPVTRAHVDLWVFDRSGRKVREILNASEGGAKREVLWDGRGDRQQLLKPGVFVLYLSARSPQGQVFQAKLPVVLTRGLSN